MANRTISSSMYRIWITFTILGIFVSVLLDHLIAQMINIDFLGQVEIYSAVWFVVLGLALMRLETVLKSDK